MFKNSINIKYLPYIDGLRAVAILSVVGFYAFPNVLPGGFIGVDIFFVISGFLVATIIQGSLKNNTFSLGEFFKNRVRRILPSLVLVLFVGFILGWILFLPDELKLYGKHLAAAISFTSNFILNNESGYFDISSDSKPLLHLWSLSIEEQFYLTFPIIFLVLWSRKLLLVSFLISIFFLSFVGNIYYVSKDPTATFYLPFTRLWELVAGVLFSAYLCSKNNKYVENIFTKFMSLKFYGEIKSCAGLIMIVCGIFFLDGQHMYPGWLALIPVLGALLIISSGSNAYINYRFFSNKTLIYIGLISFPLYLWHWHWLLLSIAKILESETPTSYIRIILLLISFILAMVTYRFVEIPFRKNKKSSSIYLLLLMSIFLFIIGLITFRANGFRFRMEESLNDRTARSFTLDVPGTSSCNFSFSDQPGAFCQMSKNPTIAILGDSHAGHLFYGFATVIPPFLT
jgi:peptidoglycan/LPS O-acetylase OafA/YrhL